MGSNSVRALLVAAARSCNWGGVQGWVIVPPVKGPVTGVGYRGGDSPVSKGSCNWSGVQGDDSPTSKVLATQIYIDLSLIPRTHGIKGQMWGLER